MHKKINKKYYRQQFNREGIDVKELAIPDKTYFVLMQKGTN